MLVNELLEALTNPAPFNILARSDDNYFAAEFMSNGRQIKFVADEEEQGWSLEFAEIQRNNDTKSTSHKFKKTGNGGEFQVFATIKAIIERFIKDYNPTVMYFMADANDASRTRLYKTLSKKFVPKNYTALINPPLEDLGIELMTDDQEIFVFVKKGFEFKKPNTHQ